MTTKRLNEIKKMGATKALEIPKYNTIIEVQNKLDMLECDVYETLSGYYISKEDVDYIHDRFSKLRSEIFEKCKRIK